MGMPVHGSVRRPAWSGEYPCTIWKNCASRNTEPNMPKDIIIDVRLAAEKVRSAEEAHRHHRGARAELPPYE